MECSYYISQVFIILIAISKSASATELLYGRNYHIRNAQNSLCLTSHANSYRVEVGVFLGQVTLESCEPFSAKQKWGIIQWSKDKDDTQFWLYPNENGLNEVTSVMDTNGLYPINNLFEFGKINIHNGRSKDERFVFHSIELHRCITSQGKSHPIAYEYCDVRNKDQQWKLDPSPEDPPKNPISGRSLISLTIDFTKFIMKKYFYPSENTEE